MSFTFQKLYNRLDKDLDLENEVWIDDDLVIEYTNDAIEKAENLINGVYADYFLDRVEMSITAGVDKYPLPVNMDGKRVRYMSIKDKDSCYKLNKQALDRILDVGVNSAYKYRLYSGLLQETQDDLTEIEITHSNPAISGTYELVAGSYWTRDYDNIDPFFGTSKQFNQSAAVKSPIYIKSGTDIDNDSEFTYLILSTFGNGVEGSWYVTVVDTPHTLWQDGDTLSSVTNQIVLQPASGEDYSTVCQIVDYISYPDFTKGTIQTTSASYKEIVITEEGNGCYLQLYPTPREDTTIDFHYLRKLPRIDETATEAEQLATVIECPVNAFIISYVKTQILEKDGDARYKLELDKLNGFTEDLTRKVSIQSADGEDTELTASRETMAHYANAHAGGRTGVLYRR